MSEPYAVVADLRAVGYPLSAAQETAAQTLIEQASAKLRIIARKSGRDIDAMIADEKIGEDYALAVKSVIVQAVIRALDSISAPTSAVTQGTESIGAYSLTYTYANAGQKLCFLKNELKDLGLYRPQQFGALEIYSSDADGDDA